MKITSFKTLPTEIQDYSTSMYILMNDLNCLMSFVKSLPVSDGILIDIIQSHLDSLFKHINTIYENECKEDSTNDLENN